MALNLKYSTTLRTDRLTTLATDVGTSAKIRIYSGSQPAGPDSSIGGATMLVELTGNASSFGSASSGVLTAGAITNGTAAATGTAAWFRIWKSDGTTGVIDGTVGTSSTDMIIDNTSINSGQTVSISSLTITGGNG